MCWILTIAYIYKFNDGKCCYKFKKGIILYNLEFPWHFVFYPNIFLYCFLKIEWHLIRLYWSIPGEEGCPRYPALIRLYLLNYAALFFNVNNVAVSTFLAVSISLVFLSWSEPFWSCHKDDISHCEAKCDLHVVSLPWYSWLPHGHWGFLGNYFVCRRCGVLGCLLSHWSSVPSPCPPKKTSFVLLVYYCWLLWRTKTSMGQAYFFSSSW